MDVASGDRQSGNLYTGARHLNGSGIRTAEGEDLQLVLDILFLGHGDELLGQFIVAKEGVVLELDSSATTQRADHTGCAGGIAGTGDVVGNADIGLDAESGGGSTTKAYLLLHREHEVHIVGYGSLLQLLGDLDENGATDAVIQRTACDSTTQQTGNTAVQSAEITDLDLLLGFLLILSADVHVATVLIEIVTCVALGNENTLEAATKGHVGKGGGDPVDTANGKDADETAILNVIDQETDLVHVGAEHDLLAIPLGSGAVLNGDQVAHGVVIALIGQRGNDGQNLIRDRLLPTRNGAGGGQSLNEVQHVFFLQLFYIHFKHEFYRALHAEQTRRRPPRTFYLKVLERSPEENFLQEVFLWRSFSPASNPAAWRRSGHGSARSRCTGQRRKRYGCSE